MFILQKTFVGITHLCSLAGPTLHWWRGRTTCWEHSRTIVPRFQCSGVKFGCWNSWVLLQGQKFCWADTPSLWDVSSSAWEWSKVLVLINPYHKTIAKARWASFMRTMGNHLQSQREAEMRPPNIHVNLWSMQLPWCCFHSQPTCGWEKLWTTSKLWPRSWHYPLHECPVFFFVFSRREGCIYRHVYMKWNWPKSYCKKHKYEACQCLYHWYFLIFNADVSSRQFAGMAGVITKKILEKWQLGRSTTFRTLRRSPVNF